MWTSEGERFTKPCIHGADPFGGLSVILRYEMVNTELVFQNEGSVTAASYIEQVIPPRHHPIHSEWTIISFVARQCGNKTKCTALYSGYSRIYPCFTMTGVGPDLNRFWDQLK